MLDSYLPYFILGLSILSGVLGVLLLISAFRQPRSQRKDAQLAGRPAAGRAAVAQGGRAVEPAVAVAALPAGDAVALDGKAAGQAARLRLEVAAISSAGYVRELNEDCLLLLELNTVRQSQVMTAHLLAVADGMGGQRAGEVASAMATRALAERVSGALLWAPKDPAEAAAPDYADVLRTAIQQANTVIHDAAQGNLHGMGTTLVTALVVGGEAYLANVGDSRAYLVTPDEIRQITVDHSLVEHLVATEQITREEASTHPERHLIYRSLGQTEEVDVDTFGQALVAGQWLLLCSDGLNRMLSDAEIREIIAAAPTPRAAAATLVERANAAGGEDNITVVAAKAM